jgi:hypothetical protein
MCLPVVNISLSARELCKVARRGGLRVGERGAAGALGRRLRVSLPQLKRRAMLSARGGGGGEQLAEQLSLTP